MHMKALNIQIEDRQHEWLRREAFVRNTSIAQIVRGLIDREMGGGRDMSIKDLIQATEAGRTLRQVLEAAYGKAAEEIGVEGADFNAYRHDLDNPIARIYAAFDDRGRPTGEVALVAGDTIWQDCETMNIVTSIDEEADADFQQGWKLIFPIFPKDPAYITGYVDGGRSDYYVGRIEDVEDKVFFAWFVDQPRPEELLPSLLAQALVDPGTPIGTAELGTIAGPAREVAQEIRACADAVAETDAALAEEIGALAQQIWGLIGPTTTMEVLFCEYEDYCEEAGLTGCITYPATITTERAESSYGRPVVVIDGEARGPGEMPPGALQVPEGIAERIRALGYEVVSCTPADFAKTMRMYEQEGHELESHWHPEATLVQF